MTIKKKKLDEISVHSGDLAIILETGRGKHSGGITGLSCLKNADATNQGFNR